jgi:hypothetical protein
MDAVIAPTKWKTLYDSSLARLRTRPAITHPALRPRTACILKEVVIERESATDATSLEARITFIRLGSRVCHGHRVASRYGLHRRGER